MMNNQTELRSQRNEVVNLSTLKCIIKRRCRYYFEILNRCQYYFEIPNRCRFIQGLLICNSLTEVAAVSMLMTYLTDVRKEKLINAAATVNILEGLSGIFSVPASFLKDYVGCYSMVLLTSQFYSMGVVLLGISALLRTFRNHSYLIENLPLYMGLILIALGRAGFNSSCVENFLEKQLKKTNDENNNDPDENINGERQVFLMRKNQVWGLMLGTILLLVVHDWRIHYGFCAFAMRFAMGVFLSGSPLYISMPIDGLVLFKCSKSATTMTDTSPYNDVDEEERKQKLHKIDEQVKENKRILLLLVPMSVTFLIYGIVKSVGSTFFLEQGNNMDTKHCGIHIPLIIIILVSSFSRTVFKIGIERLLRNRLTGTRKIHATLIRIGVGLIFTVICCATAQAVEAIRLGIVVKKGLQNSTGADDGDSVVPMSVFWLVPQFIFLGATEGLVGDGMEGFFKSELPKCMKRYASEFTTAVTGISTILSVALVSITAKASAIGGGSSWFGNTINRSHLDHFYSGLTMLCLIMCFVYAYVSTSYIHKRLPRNEEEEEEDCEDFPKPRLGLEITVV